MRPFNPNPTNHLGGFGVGDKVEICSLTRFYASWPEAYMFFGIENDVRSSCESVDEYEVGYIRDLFAHPLHPDRNIAVVDLIEGGYCVINVKSLHVLERSRTTPPPVLTVASVAPIGKVDVSFARKSSRSRLLDLATKREGRINL